MGDNSSSQISSSSVSFVGSEETVTLGILEAATYSVGAEVKTVTDAVDDIETEESAEAAFSP